MPGRSAIVCVDDDDMILVALKQELVEHFKGSYRIETAISAEEALSIMGELSEEGLRIPLVISDWLMPGMNGDEFLIAVKDKYPNTKAIVVTGYADMITVSKTRNKINLRGVITKPWDKNELIKKVETCLKF
ncbi:MAG: response regulator [Clostridiaceae bacterium]|jgi:DNA-binding NtrC family response regulator|nr:response regulator [Clostridiaceae bacterium]